MKKDISSGACVLGLDLGATKMALAAVDQRGSILRRSEAPSPAWDGGEMVKSLLELVAGGVDSCRAGGLEVEAVGIGAAGFILSEQGLLMESPNIAWKMVPLRKLVAEQTGVPVFLDNDANAAAAGERFAGAARGVDDFVFLTIGSGIGGGICIAGEIYRGHRGTAAEPGHMTIDPDGPECGCGRRGCLETLASGTALERQAALLARRDPRSLLHEKSASEPESLTGEMVAEAAERGDPAALEAFAFVARNLGLGIINLVHLLDPEVVVLGGGVSKGGHLFLEDVRRVVAEEGIPSLVEDVSIVLSTLGSDAGVVGAGTLAWEGIGGLSAK